MVVVWCDVWVLCWCCVGVGWGVCVSFLFFLFFLSIIFSLFLFLFLFLSSLSLLPPPFSPPPLPIKKEGTLYYKNISGEEFIFMTVFKLIPKKSPPGEITVIKVLY